MWNFGLKSIHELDKYITSLGISSENVSPEKPGKFLTLMKNIDPNQNNKAALHLSQRYLKWKNPALAVAETKADS